MSHILNTDLQIMLEIQHSFHKNYVSASKLIGVSIKDCFLVFFKSYVEQVLFCSWAGNGVFGWLVRVLLELLILRALFIF